MKSEMTEEQRTMIWVRDYTRCHVIGLPVILAMGLMESMLPRQPSLIQDWRWIRLRARTVAHRGNEVMSTEIGRASRGEDVRYHYHMHKGGLNSGMGMEMQKQHELQSVPSLMIQVTSRATHTVQRAKLRTCLRWHASSENPVSQYSTVHDLLRPKKRYHLSNHVGIQCSLTRGLLVSQVK